MSMTTIKKGYRLGRRPGQKGPRPQSDNRDWVEKSATGNQALHKKLGLAKEQVTVGTWNVRTLWATGQLELLKNEMGRYKYDILGLAEMRWTGSGEINGCEVIWSGEEKEHKRGVGFLLSARAKAALLGYRPVDSRIIVARFSGQSLNMSVIQVYAPTADSTEDDIEVFYEKLESTLREIPKKDIRIIVGDWNAKIGKDNTGWEDIMLSYGYGERNERGERLLEFALKHDMLICNTKFQQKDCRKSTWRSPDGRYTNMIDLIMIDKRWKTSIKLCRTFQGADISSDHSLVLCNLQLKLKHTPKKQYEKRRNMVAFENVETRAKYEKEVARKIAEADIDHSSVDKKALALSEIIKQAVEASIPLAEQPNKKWISEKTLELAQQKREVKAKTQESDAMKAKYKKLCNSVRTSSRKDKQKWLDKQCSDIEKYMGEYKTKEVFKLVKNINRKWQPKQAAIKDKEGKILMDREKTKQRWTEYCSDLYKNTDPENRELLEELEMISPPPKDDENDNILYEEVEEAIKHLKRNKSPGVDGIRGEMIKAGGKELVKEIHEICKQVWREGKIPEEWTKSVLVTIPKKGDLMECQNYRTIALISHMAKVLLIVLLSRLKAQMEEYLADEQAGFRKDRNTVQQILMLRLIAEKSKRKNRPVYNCFIDFQKAFDSIKQDITWATFRSYGVGKRLTQILKDIGERSKSAVKFGQEIGEWFATTIGTRQGDPLSPSTFIIYLERMMDGIQDNGTGISVQGERINNLRFADDIDLIEESCERLRKSVDALEAAGRNAGLRINVGKTKTMVFGQEDIESEITLGNNKIDNVKEFIYLGSLLTWDNDCTKDIRARTAKAKGVMAGFNNIWKSKQISYKTKISILRTCVFSIALYASETWTLKKTDRDKILAFEMYCYRRILQLSWTQKVTNIEVRKRLSIKDDLVQAIMKRKLELFGHISRMDNNRKIKSVMLGIIEGSNKRGRPCREWLDDIRDWCQKDIHYLSQIAQDRGKWNGMVKCALNTYPSAHGS